MNIPQNSEHSQHFEKYRYYQSAQHSRNSRQPRHPRHSHHSRSQTVPLAVVKKITGIHISYAAVLLPLLSGPGKYEEGV